MARPANKAKTPSLSVIIWANIVKWQIVKGVSDEELSAILGITRLSDRKRSHYITGDEIEKICGYLSIAPDKLLER